ncbi:endothelial cell adhesion molecule a [Pristis pectinata]|uniref:endothelial cell adhesion molecule a n=1 Tax=Pristis pectinata TaxID=685728 RepID=UPI00223E3F00|nr:endothelial cell adhesion molecule a [Pristis pectinata]
MDVMKLTLWFLLTVTRNDDVVSQGLQLQMQNRQQVSIGNSVVLTSRIVTDSAYFNVVSVVWTKGISGVIAMYANNKTVIKSQYRNRVSFLHSKPIRDVSIFINNTSLADSDHYTCTVITVNPDSMQTGETNLSVLIPPSTPKCSINGSQFIGHNVTLTCRSTSGKPVPSYTWQRITPKPQIFNFPVHNPRMGTLTLRNLTKEMSGLYTCRSINLAGNASCSIQMEVITSNNAGLIAGAAIGVLLGICLLATIIVFFCIYQRKRTPEKEEDLANEIKEDAQAPVGNVWIKNDLISKNGTLCSVNSTIRSYKPYPTKPPSYAASTITAMDVSSNGSCNHPKRSQKSDYAMTVNTHHSSPSPKWQNGTPSQAPKQEPTLPSMTSSNLARMGAVPVMVPAQSQVGSLV